MFDVTARRSLSSLALFSCALSACASAAEYAPSAAYDGMMEKSYDFESDDVGGALMAPEGAARVRSGAAGGHFAFADGAEPAPPPPPPPPDEAKPEPESTLTPSTKRLVIYTADFGVLVASVDEARARFLKDVESKGGYLQGQEDARVTVRVPAAHFQTVVDGLTDYGPITHRRIDAEDVTKRAFEMALRIENAERARTRLLALLADAREMKDILAIETELRRLTEEIELLKGQLRTLEDQVAFSTVSVDFQSSAPPPVVYGRRSSRFGWVNQVGAEHVQGGF